MKLAMVAVKDKKTGLFDPPFLVRHPNEAVREFQLITKKTETKFGQHPEDFDLYHLADYNEDSGDFENFEVKKQLTSGVQV